MSYRLPEAPLNSAVFPESYGIARQNWLALTTSLSQKRMHVPFACPSQGPEGESLMTDSLWIGPQDAGFVVVIIGGTHGVEGFTGSAVQIDVMRLLNSGCFALPDDTALLLIHALTPWGYAWRRRCDEEGVDLNRNFVDFSLSQPANEGYEILRPALFSDSAQERSLHLTNYQQLHGREALEKAISGGQYVDAQGPFYGGIKTCHGRRVIERLLTLYELAQRTLVVIDIHTGLGAFGYGEIICDHLPESDGTRTARRLFGDSVALPLLGKSSSVPKTGLLDYAWHAIMNANSCYVTLEFGSYGTDELFDVLLKDHRLWANGSSQAVRQLHSQAMVRHFCPDDQGWREMVLFRSRQVISQAVAGVTAP